MRRVAKRGNWIFLFTALAVAALLSPWASSYPDGLERVAEDQGFLERGEGKEVMKGLIPDYAFPGVKNEKLATALAGIVGTSLTFGAVWGLRLLRVGYGRSRQKGISEKSGGK
ncbi:MAG: PDGLE domain-containing protein [Thermanaeromonas sp.]|uniref:PDGLE domain-containing protein n=1 Tax=Thermanaeromonas sp. TaxID=2003697 RepID=UPI002438C957|nr:PDGLE domain-containing protein [Thermanaeromonas sp.]MCG0277494.1 PDGLE domain-containing protein [Thermanaeromonas sp.]